MTALPCRRVRPLATSTSPSGRWASTASQPTRGSTSSIWSCSVATLANCLPTPPVSITGRRAIGNLLRHYDRLVKTHPDFYPVIRLKVGGFQHRDDRVGWVNVPVLAVVGRAPKDSAAKPDTSLAADMGDEIPFNL